MNWKQCQCVIHNALNFVRFKSTKFSANFLKTDENWRQANLLKGITRFMQTKWTVWWNSLSILNLDSTERILGIHQNMYFVESSIGGLKFRRRYPLSLSAVKQLHGYSMPLHIARRHAKFSQEREYRELQSIQQT